MTQYDAFAKEYHHIALQLPADKVIAYTLEYYWGDMKGKSVLDLACGTGRQTRILKNLGAERVVGVDISKEMIRLAEALEAQNPLGIDYICQSAQKLGKIGDFDIVTAAFLFGYAPFKTDLFQMCQNCYVNLKPDGRCVAIDYNRTHTFVQPFPALEKYGWATQALVNPIEDGSPMCTTLSDGVNEVKLEVYYYSQETYHWAFQTAGFKIINWHKLMIPPQAAVKGDSDFWTDFLDISPLMVIECQK